MDANKRQNMIKGIIEFIRIIFGYCPECGEYFKYPHEHVKSGYLTTDSTYYIVCHDCAKKMNKMNPSEWMEYHLNS